jgi:hypothetical protein
MLDLYRLARLRLPVISGPVPEASRSTFSSHKEWADDTVGIQIGDTATRRHGRDWLSAGQTKAM